MACVCVCVCVKVSSPARFLFLFLFPLAQVLISQPRDQRRSLAISQREPLIPHRSARDTAAPRTPREAPQSSSRASGERERAGEREHAQEGGGAMCVDVTARVCARASVFLLAPNSSFFFAAGHETMRLEPVLIKRAFPPFNSGARRTSRQRRAIDN